EGRRQLLEADTIVLATGAVPNAGLAAALEGKGYQVYLAGDCRGPEGIPQAIHDGARIGRAI
ncbi:MAG: hypothetical protein Q8O76_11980, partial [Chloroflexota bacterium]|nr:hypothetical protein [Chloroflexota bacterium]